MKQNKQTPSPEKAEREGERVKLVMMKSFSEKTELFSELYLHFLDGDVRSESDAFNNLKEFIFNLFNYASDVEMAYFYFDTVLSKNRRSENFNKEKYIENIRIKLQSVVHLYRIVNEGQRADVLKMLVDLNKAHQKINKVLNRLDALQIAYILRENEYDIYVPCLIDNFTVLTTVKKVRFFLIDLLGIEKKKLTSLGHWGERDDLIYKSLGNNSDENKTSLVVIQRRSRRVRLEKRLEWSSTQIVEIRNKFITKHSHIFKGLSK